MVVLKTRNVVPVVDVLEEEPVRGREVGSGAYVSSSPYAFMRTQAISDASFILGFHSDSFVPIKKKDFENAYRNTARKLVREGDIFYAKGGNVGGVGIAHEDFHAVFSSHVLKLKIREELKYYVFAVLKNEFSKAQMSNLPIGAIEGLDTFKSEYFRRMLIPFPNRQAEDRVTRFVSLLTKAVVRKEAEIIKKYTKALGLVDAELRENQKSESKFLYHMPVLRDLERTARLDAGMFCEDYKQKQFAVDNYIHGAKDIFDLGFDFRRGQNLQISQIGRSVYAEDYRPNFYKLIRPLNLSDYGTAARYEYLGNPRKLQTLKRGEILFSAEGTIGKFCAFVHVDDKTLTNIHGITIFRKDKKEDDVESIFLALFLGYLRSMGILQSIAVGGQGGSLAQRYWKHIKIPSFPRAVQVEIARYYDNPVDYDEGTLSLAEFEQEDLRITSEAGIWQLDGQIKQMKEALDAILHKIIMDEGVEISFDFLKTE